MADIIFVQNYYEQTLGIMQISAVLKEHGFSTDVAIGTQAEILQKIKNAPPMVVGFYCTSGFHHKNIATAQSIKSYSQNQILTIFGGPHPTFVPDFIHTEGVDIICRGEGEFAVLELIQALKAGQDHSHIANLTVKKDGQVIANELRQLVDLDSLPFPDREIYRDYPYIYNAKKQEIMIGRGCPFKCRFCSVHAYQKLFKDKGRYVRWRSIPRVIEELKQIKERFSPSCFFFHDDTFNLNRRYTAEFLEAYKKEIGVPFSCLLRADLSTEPFINQLKESGCFFVIFGIESGNPELRNNLLNKNLSNEAILSCSAQLRAKNIPFSTFNMVGLPGESLKQVWDTVDINVRAKPRWAFFTVYQTLPGTDLAHQSVDSGCANNVAVAEGDANFHEGSIMLRNHPEGRQIINLKNTANLVVKFPIFYKLVKNILINLPLETVYNYLDKTLYFLFYYSRLTHSAGLRHTIRSAFFLFRRLKQFK